MTTKTTNLFNNQYILSKIEENKISKNLKIIQELKQIAPLLSDDELLQLYNKSISIYQNKNQENFIKNQVTINKSEKVKFEERNYFLKMTF